MQSPSDRTPIPIFWRLMWIQSPLQLHSHPTHMNKITKQHMTRQTFPCDLDTDIERQRLERESEREKLEREEEMAQANPEEVQESSKEMDRKSPGTMSPSSATSVSFKFNAQAPEFVPRSQAQMPISGYFYPCFHFIGGSGGSDWFYVGDQEPVQLIADSGVASPTSPKNFLNDDLRHKIIKQVFNFHNMCSLMK